MKGESARKSVHDSKKYIYSLTEADGGNAQRSFDGFSRASFRMDSRSCEPFFDEYLITLG
jgi:hypothetical protein